MFFFVTYYGDHECRPVQTRMIVFFVIVLPRLFLLYQGKPFSLNGEPVSMKSEIVRVVSPSTTEISEPTRLKVRSPGLDTLILCQTPEYKTC